MGAITTGILAAATLASAASSFGGGKAKSPATPVLSEPPKPDVLGETQAVTRARRRKVGSSRASSIKTGASGLTSPAPTERASLLGY